VGVRRSFTFLVRPTARQAAALAACLEDLRQLYNAALEHRRTAYARAGVSVRYGEQPAELKHIRADDPDGQGRWSFSSQQATLRRLDKAFRAFFGRVQAGRTPGFPRFKGRGWFDTVGWPKDGDGCRWDSQPGHPTATYVRSQGIGHVRVHRHRRDHARKAALALVGDYDAIVQEDLRITNMTGSAAGTIQAPGRNGARKPGLNRSILDAGWRVFLTVLARKDDRLTRAEFRCQQCGHESHADVNAATDILKAGLALRRAAGAA
jgi:transposase